MLNNEIAEIMSIFADAARYSNYGSTKHARNEYVPRIKRVEIRFAPQLIGKYEVIRLHVGQFVLKIDAGSFNKERTEFKPEALKYIRDLASMKRVSPATRHMLEHRYDEIFGINE